MQIGQVKERLVRRALPVAEKSGGWQIIRTSLNTYHLAATDAPTGEQRVHRLDAVLEHVVARRVAAARLHVHVRLAHERRWGTRSCSTGGAPATSVVRI